ncbi:OmpA family protein [Moraxella haemolytica]|uniref:OmpA family protein n=1 Tax=Moraxella haemolytica TaxID=2904119 RepID=UPI002543CC38|nr:OmpA family protein [Moraxella sp. ZY171148]WII95621.1 OmpA family protein [Moraxella sp. ZY171148]
MSLINTLSQSVTPHVLAATATHAGDNTTKSKLLSAFYAIFVSRLADEAVYNRLLALSPVDLDNGRTVFDVVFNDNDVNHATSLNDKLATEFNLPATTASTLTAVSAPLILQKLKELSGAAVLPVFLKDNSSAFSSLVPSWAYALLPVGLFGGKSVASQLDAKPVEPQKVAPETIAAKPVTTTHMGHDEQEKGGFLKSLLPIIGLIILAGLAWLLLRSCQDRPVPVAAPAEKPVESAPTTTVATDATPATLNIAVDETGDAIYSCHGQAGTESVLGSIRIAIAGVFGVDKCKLQTATGYSDTMPTAEHLPAILGLMKGVPSSSVSIADKVIRFNAANEADIQKLIDGAKGILPTDFTVEVEPKLDIAAAVAESINSAKEIISRLGDKTATDDIIRALNLQIINFEVDSDEIPAENKEILDLAAMKMADLPELTLKIIGHTDNQASHEYNKTLSEQRAAAVRDYLVSKGVPAERLSIEGASYDHPVASNATEQGRFQNRRIEFTLSQAGEQIAAVGNAPTSKATKKAQANQASEAKTDKK